jgi:pimeloyl-ACP methyl ester carboxylesterase
MLKPKLFATGLAGILGLILATPGCAADDPPRLVEAPECFEALPENIAANGGADCGYVMVPQSRTGGPAGEIGLAYMRIRGVEDTGKPPLFMLAGGPGQTIISELQLALFQPELLGGVLASRDVVLLEQRGSFRARPNLTCPELRDAARQVLSQRLDEDASEALQSEALSQCIARHSSNGVDLASYNNVENAADVNDVRAALGCDMFVFYGASYGTLLGQFVMRAYPEYLAAVVLDGTETPTTRSWVENRAERVQWGIDHMAELCARQPDCAASYDILAEIENVFSVFGDEPITVSVPLPEGFPATGEFDVTVAPANLAETIYGLQTSKYGVAALPTFLEEQISAGRDELVRSLATQSLDAAVASLEDDESGSVGLMHMAMVCSDDPPGSLEDVRVDNSGRYASVFGEVVVASQYVGVCDMMDLPVLPASSDEPVVTDIPVLLLSGGLDVQTPSFLADEVASGLPNATHVVFPSGFHVQIANLNRCAISVFTAFLDDPTSVPDTTCTADDADLVFLLPDAE